MWKPAQTNSPKLVSLPADTLEIFLMGFNGPGVSGVLLASTTKPEPALAEASSSSLAALSLIRDQMSAMKALGSSLAYSRAAGFLALERV